MASNPGLVDKISAEALNQVIEQGVSKGQPALLWLCWTPEGRQILSSNQSLVDKISIEALNQVIEQGVNKDKSALFWLCRTPEGRQILTSNQSLVNKISAEALNQVIEQGINKDKSALFWLCKTENESYILSSNQSLVNKISIEALNQVVDNSDYIDADTSALFWLCYYPQGRALIIDNSRLIDQVSTNALHSTMAIPAGVVVSHTTTAFYELISSKEWENACIEFRKKLSEHIKPEKCSDQQLTLVQGKDKQTLLSKLSQLPAKEFCKQANVGGIVLPDELVGNIVQYITTSDVQAEDGLRNLMYVNKSFSMFYCEPIAVREDKGFRDTNNNGSCNKRF